MAVINEVTRIMDREGVPWDVTYLHNEDRPSSLLRDVEFVRGGPFNTNDPLKAGVNRASVIIITPFNDLDLMVSNARVTLLLMNVRRLNGNAYVITEVLNGVDRDYVMRAGVSSVVSLGSYTTVLMAKEVFDHGVSRIITELIRDSRVEVISGEGFVRARFIDVISRLKTERGYLVFGIMRDGTLIINPDYEFVVKSGDSLLVIN